MRAAWVRCWFKVRIEVNIEVKIVVRDRFRANYKKSKKETTSKTSAYGFESFLLQLQICTYSQHTIVTYILSINIFFCEAVSETGQASYLFPPRLSNVNCEFKSEIY